MREKSIGKKHSLSGKKCSYLAWRCLSYLTASFFHTFYFFNCFSRNFKNIHQYFFNLIFSANLSLNDVNDADIIELIMSQENNDRKLSHFHKFLILKFLNNLRFILQIKDFIKNNFEVLILY